MKENRLFWSLIYFVLGLFLLITYARLFSISGQDIFNNYPFMYPDSFDWLYNGIYYLERFFLNVPSENVVPRDILLPIFSFLGYLLGWPWLIFLLLFSVHLLGYIYLIKTGQLLNIKDRWIFFLALSFVFHFGVTNFRFYILSDNLAVYLNIVSTYYFLKYFKQDSSRDLILGSLICAFSSIAAKYGLYPAIFANALNLFLLLKEKDKKYFRYIFLSSAIALSLPLLWLIFKKIHYGSFSVGPDQFSLLAFSTQNTSFYFNTLSVFYFPFLTILGVLIFSQKLKWEDIFKGLSQNKLPLFFLLSLVLTTFSFLYFYQWQESRFTTYKYFYTILLFCLILNNTTPLSKWTYGLCAALFLSLNLVPYDQPMGPKLKNYLMQTAELSMYSKNIYRDLFQIAPQDRYNVLNLCPSGFCPEVKTSIPTDPYMKYTFTRYYCYQLKKYPCQLEMNQ